MRKMDLSVEGVFRKNGNIKKLSELSERIDRDGCDNTMLEEQNVVQLAALLKRYLRDLPDPLMTYKLHRLWLAAAKIIDKRQTTTVSAPRLLSPPEMPSRQHGDCVLLLEVGRLVPSGGR